MAAEQRLRKTFTYLCERVCGCFRAYLISRLSFFHCEQALLHTYASCSNMHCFSRLSSAAGRVCVCFSNTSLNVCFLFSKWLYLIKVLQLRLHSRCGTPGCAPISVMIPMTFFILRDTHNSYGLICCSFPLASAFPLFPTNGLNGSGSQSATPVGGKITMLLLFTRFL